MFDDIGGKIKSWAKVVCWAGIVASVILGITVIVGATTKAEVGSLYKSYENVTNWSVVCTGVMIILFGSIGAWVGSFALYGFGQLIAKTEENNVLLKEIASANASSEDTPASPSGVTMAQWKCKKCGTMNPTTRMSCKDCGEYR